MNRVKNLAFCDATLLGYKKNGHRKFPYDICFSIHGKEQRLPWHGRYMRTKIEESWDKYLVSNNKIGSIQLSDNDQGFYFECYLDQSLRRKPELDTVRSTFISCEIRKNRINIPCVGWCNQSCPDGFLVPKGIIPHSGHFIADESTTLEIKIPKELEEICDEFGISGEVLLNDLINNVGNFSNSSLSPRADFRSCKEFSLHQLSMAYIKAINSKREAI